MPTVGLYECLRTNIVIAIGSWFLSSALQIGCVFEISRSEFDLLIHVAADMELCERDLDKSGWI